MKQYNSTCRGLTAGKLRLRFFILLTLSFLLIPPTFAHINFLTINDIHYGNKNNSLDGQDTGDEFLKVALKRFEQLTSQVSFILVLGDLPTHSWLFNAKKPEFESAVFQGLYEEDKSLKPLFFINGNNDSLGGNYQPFEYEGKSPLTYAPGWKGACAYCEGLMIDDSYMQTKGFYSSYVLPSQEEIILIALNTNSLASIPFFVGSYPNQEKDATEQLDWLEGQLKKLHAKQLLIATHIPPGNSYKGALLWRKKYLQRFIDLLEKYHSSFDEITLLSGHTHMDEIRRIKLKTGPSIYVYLSPSVGRNHHNNSGMKVFNLDDQLMIKNYTTYYTTQLFSWGDEQYQAMGSDQAIFPECQPPHLSACLEQFDKEQLCAHLEQDLFYGVKSDRVPKNVCNKTFPVN